MALNGGYFSISKKKPFPLSASYNNWGEVQGP